ncbi:MFS transporter [Roseovarius autotrophicus]|uniref:MFS transporter n=1 Tax=Roseovarius autotrophicus TaxID=2824121 RepID=UPI001A0BC082|nr:MFS transporter [Roseovarius autotrophicus]MBE0453731.1 MFS transporter [Roseovarius sp.]
MRAGLVLLCLAYVLSQFFRAFLAVLSGPLERDIGTTPDDLAFASGLWFLVFAAMQLPVGAALDRLGPRRTAAGLLLIGGGGGAALFAMATAPWQVNFAMALIGAGCSPVLMASYYIFARQFPPARFATLAALMLGVGSVGNLVAAWPMAWAAETMGWRAALWGLAGLSAAVAAGVIALVRDPEAVTGKARGSVLDLLRMPALWAILPLMFVAYAPSAALRGLWAGPYLRDVFALDTGQVGQATLVMGLAMIAGTFAYGPLDRIFRTRKWVIFGGNLVAALALAALILWPDNGLMLSVALLALVGFAGASFPVVIAHGRAFIPPHLAGRGVTLLNLFGIGGVGVAQFASGPLHATASAQGVLAGHVAIFALFAGALALGLALYLFSRDSLD